MTVSLGHRPPRTRDNFGRRPGNGVFRKIKFAFRGRLPGPGATPVHVDDPRFDAWEVVRDFSDVRTARAWHQALEEAGIEAVLTVDWPVDRFGRGDIALRVRPQTGARPSCSSPTSTTIVRLRPASPARRPVVRLGQGSSPCVSRPHV